MRAGIVGCGVAGMASAIALARQGHEVEILERFDAPRPLGAGLLLQPTGLAALDALGLGDAVRAKGAAIERLAGRTARGREVLRLAYQGATGLGIHRASLFSALHDGARAAGVTITTGVTADWIEQAERGAWVIEPGRRAHGPYGLIVAADGAASTLRPRIVPRARAPEYPWGAFWSIFPDPAGEWTQALRQVYERCRVMIGVLPVGQAPGAPDDLNHAAVFWSLKTAELAGARDDGPDALRAAIAARWPEAAELISGAPSMSCWADAVYRDVRARPWIDDRAVLIGDAAHGTSPQLGQGANLALIDALALAHAVGPAHEERDVAQALRAYAAARSNHVGYYQFMSRALTPFFQSDSALIAGLRDTLLGPLCRLPVSSNIMRATLTGRARWGVTSWRGPWERA